MVPGEDSATEQELLERLRSLEAEVKLLKERVRALETGTTKAPEHPVDQQMVRSKVAYDWQT